MRIVSIPFLLFFVTSACAAAPEAYESVCLSTINQEAKLKTFLLPIDLNNPADDAKQRLNHGDTRFLAIGDIGIKIPGLPSGGEHWVCLHGTRVVDGITDVGGDDEYNELVARVRRYVVEYNKSIYQHLSKRGDDSQN